MSVVRFGVSLEEEHLEMMKEYAKKHKISNRSQVIRHLIEQNLKEFPQSENQEVAGAIILIYDHNKRDLASKTLSMQHEYHCLVLAVQHLHLNEESCMEIVAVKGRLDLLKKLANKMTAIKGIRSGKLVIGDM